MLGDGHSITAHQQRSQPLVRSQCACSLSPGQSRESPVESSTHAMRCHEDSTGCDAMACGVRDAHISAARAPTSSSSPMSMKQRARLSLALLLLASRRSALVQSTEAASNLRQRGTHHVSRGCGVTRDCAARMLTVADACVQPLCCSAARSSGVSLACAGSAEVRWSIDRRKRQTPVARKPRCRLLSVLRMPSQCDAPPQ